MSVCCCSSSGSGSTRSSSSGLFSTALHSDLVLETQNEEVDNDCWPAELCVSDTKSQYTQSHFKDLCILFIYLGLYASIFDVGQSIYDSEDGQWLQESSREMTSCCN